ncbi:MAG: OmpA family protein [Sphingomonadales bacterium]|nr:MAG: OmpA family protein [Sphingomonadales bacterium]
MNRNLSSLVQWLLMVLAIAGLSACQTVPPSSAMAFTAAQREALIKRGFEDGGGNYLLGLNNRLLFGFDTSAIDPPQDAMLRTLASELAAVGIRGAKVEGHASNEGDPQHNLILSRRRAEAVSAALTAGGFDAKRMQVVALGATDPVASNRDATGRRQNRRVVIVVTPADTLPI